MWLHIWLHVQTVTAEHHPASHKACFQANEKETREEMITHGYFSYKMTTTKIKVVTVNLPHIPSKKCRKLYCPILVAVADWKISMQWTWSSPLFYLLLLDSVISTALWRKQNRNQLVQEYWLRLNVGLNRMWAQTSLSNYHFMISICTYPKLSLVQLEN